MWRGKKIQKKTPEPGTMEGLDAFFESLEAVTENEPSGTL